MSGLGRLHAVESGTVATLRFKGLPALFARPGAEAGTVRVSPGAAGNVEVTGTGADIAITTGAVWVKSTLARAGAVYTITAAEIGAGAEMPADDPPDEETGEPGEHHHYLLATVAAGGAIRNTGAGSLGFFPYVTGRVCWSDPQDPETPPETRDLYAIAFYRVQPAAVLDGGQLVNVTLDQGVF